MSDNTILLTGFIASIIIWIVALLFITIIAVAAIFYAIKIINKMKIHMKEYLIPPKLETEKKLSQIVAVLQDDKIINLYILDIVLTIKFSNGEIKVVSRVDHKDGLTHNDKKLLLQYLSKCRYDSSIIYRDVNDIPTNINNYHSADIYVSNDNKEIRFQIPVEYQVPIRSMNTITSRTSTGTLLDYNQYEVIDKRTTQKNKQERELEQNCIKLETIGDT